MENNSDKHHVVIDVFFKIIPRKIRLEKIQKWCILSFQDATVSSKGHNNYNY